MSRAPRNSKTSGRKAPNIYDVAREARVSVFTVSAVINKKEHVGAVLKKRVEAAIRKLDYRPNSLAQSLARERTHTIGVIVPDISNPFFPMVVRGAEDAAQKQGYSILLCNSDGILEKEELYLELLLSKRVDGILLTKAPGELSARVRRMIADMKVPCVLMMRTYPILTEDAVITDDLKGSFDAVSHLVSQGAECEWSEIRAGISLRRRLPHRIRTPRWSFAVNASSRCGVCRQLPYDGRLSASCSGTGYALPRGFRPRNA